MTASQSNAAQRIAAIDELDAETLCARADAALTILVGVLNEETTLLRAGRYREATTLTNRKTELAQDYVVWARAVQRQAARLRREAPAAVDALRGRHESFTTQLAENLRVIATARNVTEDLLTDVARAIDKSGRPTTYGAGGAIAARPASPTRGLAVNRAL